MNNDYEKLRLKQLEFLESWNREFVQFHRKNNGHHNFSLNYELIYTLRVDDLVDFVNKNKMTFEFDYYINYIIFKDIMKG